MGMYLAEKRDEVVWDNGNSGHKTRKHEEHGEKCDVITV